MADVPKVAVFGPDPMLSIAIEPRGEEGDDIHLHAAGQGVWVARMAAELGARPVLCGFAGGETGAVLRHLLAQLPIDLRLVETAADSGAYLHDRRSGERQPVAQSAAALAVCNPYPGEALPLEIYGNLVADVRANGTPVLVDLSSPRLDSALEGAPD
ncbi:MAG: PfkB family carbohydrate kinase, partial [Syntrophothermus sp.]